jgi:hypothetical protein
MFRIGRQSVYTIMVPIARISPIAADAALMATPRWRFQNLPRELFQFDSAAFRPLIFGLKPLLPVCRGLQF